MSDAASTIDSQTPRQEALDRVMEYLPQSLGIRRLLGIKNESNIIADARARTADSHRLQMQSLYDLNGKTMPELSKPEEEMITVAGDTNINITAPPEQKASGMSTLAKLGIGAAAATAGVGLPTAGFIAAHLLKDPPAAVAPAEPGPPMIDRDTYVPYDFSIE